MRFPSLRGPGLAPVPFAFAVSLVALMAVATPAIAQQVVLQNDSVVDLGSAAIQAGFADDERGAAWLTATCDGSLSAVQIAWLSFLGGQPQTLGQAITISDPGSFPVPGTQLVQLLGPLMNDGFFNQFVVVPPVAVTNGQVLVVDFQFLFGPPVLGPSLVTDIDGCQAVANGIFAIPPSSWFDACLLGVSGDLAIRAVVDCDGLIFEDGFETGDVTAWSTAVGNLVPAARSVPALPVIRGELVG